MPKRIVPPEPRLLRGLREAVRADLERAGLDASVVDDAVFCMHEACLNAMQHGRGELHVHWEVADGRVRFEVRDQGPGVVLTRLDQPPAPDRQSGRGLFLIDRLADWLETGARGPMHYVAFALGQRRAPEAATPQDSDGRPRPRPLTRRLASAMPGRP